MLELNKFYILYMTIQFYIYIHVTIGMDRDSGAGVFFKMELQYWTTNKSQNEFCFVCVCVTHTTEWWWCAPQWWSIGLGFVEMIIFYEVGAVGLFVSPPSISTQNDVILSLLDAAVLWVNSGVVADTSQTYVGGEKHDPLLRRNWVIQI
jgi:hypothetical protein